MAVVRFGVSLETDLLEALDHFSLKNAFANRSQAIRFLIEKNIVENKWMCNNEVAGVVVLFYEASKHDVAIHLLEIQQVYAKLVLSTQRFFLHNGSFLEVVTVKGTAQRLTEFSDKMISLKGMKHGKLVMSRIE